MPQGVSVVSGTAAPGSPPLSCAIALSAALIAMAIALAATLALVLSQCALIASVAVHDLHIDGEKVVEQVGKATPSSAAYRSELALAPVHAMAGQLDPHP